MVAEEGALRETHILDIIMSGRGLRRPLTARSSEGDFRSVELYATVAIDQMNYLESSADFDSLLPAKHKLAFAVKAYALVSYLNACTLNEDAADGEVLMAWLEEALGDPSGMANHELAPVVLKSMALLCRSLLHTLSMSAACFLDLSSRVAPKVILWWWHQSASPSSCKCFPRTPLLQHCTHSATS